MSGNEALKVIGMQNKTNLQSISYFVIMGRHGYLVTCITLKDDYDTYAKDIDAIVKSFKLIEVK